MINELFDVSLWRSLTIKDQDQIIFDFGETHKKELIHLFTRTYGSDASLRIPTFRDINSGIEMNLILGGTFEMGFSGNEEEQAFKISNEVYFDPDQMRPVHSERVTPFLMSRFPILERFACDNVEINLDLFRPEFGESGENIPIYLNWNELRALTSKFSLTIPTEIQWEYAYRGNTNSLFYFGESLPDEEELENQILLFNFDNEDSNINAANPFGLIGLQIGEWCRNEFMEDYESYKTIADDSKMFPRVIRGGAASLYPWQGDNEWELCISATRRSSDELEDGTCGARFVKEIDL